MDIGILGTVAGFAVTVGLVRKRVNYGLAMIIGALVIFFTSGLYLTELFDTVRNAMINPTTVDLVVLVIFINMIGYALKKTGQIDEILAGFRKIISSRGTVGAIPTLFGMLPMPGGALLSAPVMEPEAERLGADSEQKTVINFWFRHFIFFIFPFSPDLVLAARLGEVEVYQLILIQIPIFFLSILVGYLFYIRPLKRESIKGERDVFNGLWTVGWGLSSILIAILLNMTLGISLRYMVPLAFLLLLLQNYKRLNSEKTFDILKTGFPPNLILAVAGIMFFREVVEQSGSLDSFINATRAAGIPVELIILLAPFLVAVLTGIGMAAIGISFPLILPFIPEISPGVVSVLFVSCYLGYLMSPVHLCMIVTREYFGSSLGEDLAKVGKPVSVLMLYNAIMVFLVV